MTHVSDPGALADIRCALRMGETDPVRLLDASLARIAAIEPHVQAFRIVDGGRARQQAAQLDSRMQAAQSEGRAELPPLHGIPVAIKDVIDVAGLPTRAGSRTRENAAPAGIDASLVARLRAAGAVIVGKAHTTEFAYFDGPPPTRNPHDLSRTPGGSSAGPAAAVAAGMVPLALGTQTAGSVSRPAAYCGIAAFKPSTLSWPAFGVVPFAPSFDTIGVFGFRFADAAFAARALTPAFLPAAPLPAPQPPRIAVVDDPVLDMATEAVRASVRSASEKLAASGAQIATIASPVPFADVIVWHKTVSEFELARAHGALLEAPEGDVSAGLREAIARGRRIDEKEYFEALRHIDLARAEFWPAIAGYDALIFPAAPDIAPVGIKTGDPRFIIPFTALGGPIASLPVAFDASLPLGIMLTAAPGRDQVLLDLAERLAPTIEMPR